MKRLLRLCAFHTGKVRSNDVRGLDDEAIHRAFMGLSPGTARVREDFVNPKSEGAVKDFQAKFSAILKSCADATNFLEDNVIAMCQNLNVSATTATTTPTTPTTATTTLLIIWGGL
jgi:hypothetical protein